MSQNVLNISSENVPATQLVNAPGRLTQNDSPQGAFIRIVAARRVDVPVPMQANFSDRCARIII